MFTSIITIKLVNKLLLWQCKSNCFFRKFLNKKNSRFSLLIYMYKTPKCKISTVWPCFNFRSVQSLGIFSSIALRRFNRFSQVHQTHFPPFLHLWPTRASSPNKLLLLLILRATRYFHIFRKVHDKLKKTDKFNQNFGK